MSTNEKKPNFFKRGTLAVLLDRHINETNTTVESEAQTTPTSLVNGKTRKRDSSNWRSINANKVSVKKCRLLQEEK